jgi:hypothetical protein
MKHVGFKLIIAGLVAVVGLCFALAPTAVLAADNAAKDNFNKICDSNPDASICKEGTINTTEDPDIKMMKTVQNVVNVLLFVAGIIAVIVIVVSGIKFVSSRGDSGAVTKARQTLMHAVIGLVVTVMAFAIVNFVISRLGDTSGGSGGGPTTPAVITSNYCTSIGKVYRGPINEPDGTITPAQCI